MLGDGFPNELQGPCRAAVWFNTGATQRPPLSPVMEVK